MKTSLVKSLLTAVMLLSFTGHITCYACDVCPAGCTYTSIQAAIDDAVSGDIIEVCDGTYYENIDFQGKNITVVSENGSETTIIDGGRDGPVVTFNSGEGPEALLSGFTLQNGAGYWIMHSYGGGIYITGASPTITACHITSNSANHGGGVYMEASGAAFDNCIFEWNTTASTYEGGGISGIDSSPTITGCTFDNNYTGENGGGIFCINSTLACEDTLFESNSAGSSRGGNGGAISLESSSATITDCTFLENSSEDNGGAFWCDDACSDIIINGSTFSDNTSGYQGGAVCTESPSVLMESCTLSDNSTILYGGGIYILSASTGAALSDLTVQGNQSNGYGGGIAVYLGSAALNNCTLSENYAEWAGGGMWTYFYGNASLSSCKVSRNTAGGDGGGLFAADTSGLNLVNTIVDHNKVEDASPGYGNGGGISIYNGSVAELMNCTVRGNTATEHGGGIYCQASEFSAANSIFWFDTPEEFYLDYSDSPDVTYSNIQGGFAGTGNIDSFPFFVNIGDSHLREASPCIDAGSSADSAALDIDGDTRPQGTEIDMGADEFTVKNYPEPQLLANGESEELYINPVKTEEVIFTIGVNNNGRTDNCDFWILQVSPYGLYFLGPSGWEPFPPATPLYQGALTYIAPYDLPPVPTEGLMEGDYYFAFAVDTLMDGLVTWDQLFGTLLHITVSI